MSQPTVSFESLNFPGYYIRHRNFVGALTEAKSDLDRNDATFFGGRPALGSSVVFRSVNWPTFRLRHENFVIKLQEELLIVDRNRPPTFLTPESELYQADSTFIVEAGLADPAAVPFRVANFPRYIRHRNFHLYLQEATDSLSKADSTFKVTTGLIAGPPDPQLG